MDIASVAENEYKAIKTPHFDEDFDKFIYVQFDPGHLIMKFFGFA